MLRPAPEVAAFAVAETTAQLAWRKPGTGPTRVTVANQTIDVAPTGGPGAVVVEALDPDTHYVATVERRGLATSRVEFRTLTAPPGAPLCRIATMSDLHLGCAYFGYTKLMRERPAPDEPSSDRCARAAMTEIDRWGPDRVVLKGDVVHLSNDSTWDVAAGLAVAAPQPVGLLPGNHEVGRRRELEVVAAARARGFVVADPVVVIEHGGVRLVLADTTIEGHHEGRIDHVTEEVAEAVGDATGPAVVLLHHNLQTTRYPTFKPPGIRGDHARKFLDTIAAANPATIVTSGHTHRHRRRVHRGVVVVETGSPKDYPGTWTAMVVHEGGVRHEVRRVMRPDCLAWTERTRRAALGLWGRWSPGQLGDRCFTHRWPT